MYNSSISQPAASDAGIKPSFQGRSSMPRDKWIYTVIGSVFGACIVTVPFILFTASQLFYAKGEIESVFKSDGSLKMLLVICGLTFAFGTLSGLITGLLIEKIHQTRNPKPIVSAALGGAIWGGLTSFIILIVPIAILTVLIITIVIAFQLIAVIVVAIPFSSLYFALTVALCRKLAENRVLKIYQIFFLALATAIIYCAALPVIFISYTLITYPPK